jgi:hypothetical protein
MAMEQSSAAWIGDGTFVKPKPKAMPKPMAASGSESASGSGPPLRPLLSNPPAVTDDSMEHPIFCNCWVIEASSYYEGARNTEQKLTARMIMGRWWLAGYSEDGSPIYKKEDMRGWAGNDYLQSIGRDWSDSDEPLFMFQVPQNLEAAGWWIASTFTAEHAVSQPGGESWLAKGPSGPWPTGS